MRELSGEQRTEREQDPDVNAGSEPPHCASDHGSDPGRGWLWHGFAALGISALGLAVAAAVGLTTDAQTTQDLSAVPDTSRTVAAPVEKLGNKPATTDPALAAFGKREIAATSRSTRNATIRLALVEEQAAQRDELLAKTADEISQAAQTASSDARQQELKLADRASRKAAAQIAAENLRRAVAARVAAASKRQAVESQATNPEAGSSKSDPGNGSAGQGSGSAGSDGSGSGSGGGVSPVPGAVVGAHFGEYGSWSRYHTGLDFRASYGTPIRAVKAGVVLYAGNSGDWAGNHVAIKHADGMTTMYSHMSSMAARAGQTVQAGEVIGRVGQTGRAFGAHLHFELYPPGIKYGDVYKAINPQPWLARIGVTTH
jgi:murein DD-endopeptidase MepM/ murein hydrolase activator NlpD